MVIRNQFILEKYWKTVGTRDRPSARPSPFYVKTLLTKDITEQILAETKHTNTCSGLLFQTFSNFFELFLAWSNARATQAHRGFCLCVYWLEMLRAVRSPGSVSELRAEFWSSDCEVQNLNATTSTGHTELGEFTTICRTAHSNSVDSEHKPVVADRWNCTRWKTIRQELIEILQLRYCNHRATTLITWLA